MAVGTLVVQVAVLVHIKRRLGLVIVFNKCLCVDGLMMCFIVLSRFECVVLRS